MEITIREAGLEDSADIVRLISEHARAAGETSPLAAAYVGHYLTSPVSAILLAELDQRVVGLLSWSVRPDLYHAGNACLIEELIVQEEIRDRGVGGALMDGLFARLAGRGCAEVSVAVMAANTRAIRFYRSHHLCDEALLLEMHFSE